MSFDMILTYTRKPSKEIMELLKKLYEDTPEDKKGWEKYFDTWHIPELVKDLENGIKAAENILDAQAKGFKPVAEGKETSYCVHYHYPEIEYCYTRKYTR